MQWVASMVRIKRRPPLRETNPLAISNDFDGFVWDRISSLGGHPFARVSCAEQSQAALSCPSAAV
jgi:hypothetical protein